MNTVKALALRLLSEEAFLKFRHLAVFRYWPSTKSPRAFNEFIISLMLTRREEALRRTFADKVAVRSYVADKIGEKYLPRVIGVLDGVEQLANYTAPFAVKGSHGSGMTIIVRRAADLDVAAKQTIQGWLDTDFYDLGKEYVYKDLPRRLIVEELLAGRSKGAAPDDFKVFVFDGRATCIQVDIGRFGTHKRAFFRPDWTQLDVDLGKLGTNEEVLAPASLREMLWAAEELGKEVCFARVDFYDVAGRLFFGEVTNFPHGGNSTSADAVFRRYPDLLPASFAK